MLMLKAISCLLLVAGLIAEEKIPSNEVEEDQSKEIIMIIEIYSSGSRSPVNSNILNEAWVEEVGLGRITGNGMRQQFNLGTHIRNTHLKFFEKIDTDRVKVFSSGRSRSLISALSHNHGLFPSGSRWNPEEQLTQVMKDLTRLPPCWKSKRNIATSLRSEFFSEPVALPLQTVDQFNDFMFLPRIDRACPKAKMYRDSFRAAHLKDRVIGMDSFLAELRTEVEKINSTMAQELTNKETYQNNSNLINHLNDVLTASLYQNGQLPKGFSKSTYAKLRRAASGYFMLKFEKDEIRKLYTSKISETILSEVNRLERSLETKDALDKHLSYLGFSGDDDTVASFLHLFGLSSPACHFTAVSDSSMGSESSEVCQPIPPYSSTLLFEILRNKKDGSLTINPTYNHKPLFPDAHAKGGIPEIPLDAFVSILEDKGLQDDFEELCGNKHVEVLKKGSYGLAVFLLLLSICAARAGLIRSQKEEKALQNKVK